MNILAVPVVGEVPPRSLEAPKIFVLEVGKDGFNAYAIKESAQGLQVAEIFAASSSISTFLKVMGTVASSNGNGSIEFSVKQV